MAIFSDVANSIWPFSLASLVQDGDQENEHKYILDKIKKKE